VNAHDIVVFLGPSLSIDQARRTLPARYLGPARCGDVLRARRLSPRAIAIVDGVFASTPAIWHKEILLALEDGIAVFGASSMGALRAAELVPFGMVGIGRIFEAYRDGVYTDDDEVALLHGPADSAYRGLSEAMVNIRSTVAHAVASGIIRPDSGERVIRCAKDTFYQERSLGAAIESAWRGDAHAEEASRFRRFIQNGGYVNQKRLDALELLAYIRDGKTQPAVVPPVHRTSLILKLHYQTTCRPFDAPDIDLPPDEHVVLEAAALGGIYPPLCRLAQLMTQVHALADGLPTTEAEQSLKGGPNSRSDFALKPAKTRRRTTAGDLDLDVVARQRFEERLGRIRMVVDDYARRHGRREAGRSQRRDMLDMSRIDDAYRRLRRARQPGVEISVYRRIATLWAIVDEQLERARVDLPVTLQVLSDEFRRKRGLQGRADTLAWWRANDLDLRGFERLVAMDARLALVSAGSHAHALGLRPLTNPTCWLLDAIRLVGLDAHLKGRVRRAGARAAREPRERSATRGTVDRNVVRE
jgi:hypothetical protein